MSNYRIAVITYESRHAPSGGIAAVIRSLPVALQQVSGQPVLVISPFHWKIMAGRDVVLQWVREIEVDYNSQKERIEIWKVANEYGCSGGESETSFWFLKAQNPCFFSGYPHPYALPVEDLRRDSWFFGSACAVALETEPNSGLWKVMMQDWETATAVSFLKQDRYKCFLTLHNCYDFPRGSVLDWTLHMENLKWPIFTVSEQYAEDLRNDPFQRDVMASHLQDIWIGVNNCGLSNRLVGVNNGTFLKRDPSVCRGKLLQAKDVHKTAVLEALEKGLDMRNVPEKPRKEWGDARVFAKKASEAGKGGRARRSPWFIMAGRDDPRQKGYDVACLAIRAYIEAGGDGQFIFAPMPGDGGLEWLDCLVKLTQDHPDKVLFLPYRLCPDIYPHIMGACVFGLMPSIYEPFGMANEFYAVGLMGIARATGGLVQQIVPVRDAGLLSEAALWMVDRWHSKDEDKPTGILYREPESLWTRERWAAFARADVGMRGQDIIHTRQWDNPLYQGMIEGLKKAMDVGCRLYQDRPDEYVDMVVRGADDLEKNFSWKTSAQRYLEVMEKWS